MAKCEIIPVPDGHRKVITEDQLEALQKAVASAHQKVVHTGTKTRNELRTSPVQTRDEPDQTVQKNGNQTEKTCKRTCKRCGPTPPAF